MNTTAFPSITARPNYSGNQNPSLFDYIEDVRNLSPNLLHELVQRFGTTIRLPLGRQPKFLVASPAGVERILQSNQHNYEGFKFSHEELHPLLGSGLLTSEGAVWRKHRRLAQQAFHKSQLEKIAGIMAITITGFLDEWTERIRSRATLDLGPEMALMALRVVNEALFGNKIGMQAGRVREAWPVVMDHMANRIFNPFRLPERLTPVNNRQYQQSLAFLNETVYSLIARQRAAPGKDDNLLSMLISARDEQHSLQLDDDELRDEVMTIFLAGHETCANALTWTIYLLAKHPDVQECLVEEVATVLQGQEPGYGDLERLPYAAMVFNEALRLYPPAWIMARDAVHADTIEGRNIPAGATVFLSPYVTQRLSAYWEEPLQFDPLRFSPECIAERPRFAYFPFGGGQRQCLGKNFALIEARLALPLMIRRFRFSLHETTRYIPSYSMRPQKPIWLEIEKR